MPARITCEFGSSRSRFTRIAFYPQHAGAIELQLGRFDDTSPCFIVPAAEAPAPEARFVVVQPDVMERDPTRGWVPIGGAYADGVLLGRAATPELRLGRDVSREHCSVHVNRVFDHISISDDSRNGTSITLDGGTLVELQM